MWSRFTNRVKLFFCLILLSPVYADAQNASQSVGGNLAGDQPSRKLDDRSIEMGGDVPANLPLPTSVDDENILAAAFVCADPDQPARATEFCTALIELMSDQAALFVLRSGAYLGVGDIEAAEADIEQALDLNIVPPAYYYLLGYNLIEIGQYEEAIVQLTKFIEAVPGVSMAYSERSYAYSALGDDTRALADLERALELDPENKSALESRSTYLAKKGRTDAAISDMARTNKAEGELAARAEVMWGPNGSQKLLCCSPKFWNKHQMTYMLWLDALLRSWSPECSRLPKAI